MLNLRQDFVHSLVDLAAHVSLKDSLVVVDDAVAEALRWNGGIPILLRDLNARNLISWTTFLQKKNNMDELICLFDPFQLRPPIESPNKHTIIVMVATFLWEIETELIQLLHHFQLAQTQGSFDLIVCTTCSEKSHECSSMHTSKRMIYRDFEAHVLLEAGIGCHSDDQENRGSEEKSDDDDDDVEEEEEEEEWEWNEDVENEYVEKETVRPRPAKEIVNHRIQLSIRHLPLHYSTLIQPSTEAASMTGQLNSPPSTFVFTNAQCAMAFPLQLMNLEAANDESVYSDIQSVRAEDIPPAFRQAFKLVAMNLSEMMMQWRLQVKENIFALGSTSLKIGHTLVRGRLDFTP